MTAAVPLRVVPPPEPDQDMVDMLERFLERARAGELNFLACIATYKESGAVCEGYVKRDSAHNFTILGVLECAKVGFLAHHTNREDFG